METPVRFFVTFRPFNVVTTVTSVTVFSIKLPQTPLHDHRRVLCIITLLQCNILILSMDISRLDVTIVVTTPRYDRYDPWPVTTGG